MFFNKLFKCSKSKPEITYNDGNIDSKDTIKNISQEITPSPIFERQTDKFEENILPYNILQEAYNSNVSNNSDPRTSSRYNLIYSIGNNYLKSNSPKRPSIDFIKKHITDSPRRTNIEFIKRQNTEYPKKYELEIPKDIKERPKSSNATSLERYKFSEANIIDPEGNNNECIILEHDIDEHITEIENTLNTIKNNTSDLQNSYEKKIIMLEKNNAELQEKNDILQKELDKLRLQFLYMNGCI